MVGLKGEIELNLDNFENLIKIVPQTYGEAIKLYHWLPCENHEWDNRTTIENATYLINNMKQLLNLMTIYK